MKIVELKEFTYFFRVKRNEIVDVWLESEELKSIFMQHSMRITQEDTKVFHDFLDCFVSVIQWQLTIAECPIKMKFLKLLHEHDVSNIDFFHLFIALKNAIASLFYQHEFLSFGLQKDLEEVSLRIGRELYITYSQLQDREIDFASNHSNLLNEYKKAVDLSNIVSKANTKGVITYVNDQFCQICGYTKGELIGKPHSIVRHPSMPSSVFKELWDTIKSKRSWRGLITNMRKDGRKYVVDSTVVPILDIDGDIVEYIAIRHDVTEFEQTKEQLSTLNLAMKHKVDELYSMTAILEAEASVDGLTGAFNRAKFEKIFDIEIEKAMLKQTDLTMIVLDIDHFKAINDNYGHHVGDDVLKSVATLIAKHLKRLDIFARWGGEEFVILLPETSLDGATVLAEKVRQIIERGHFSMVGNVSASFGVGQYEREREDKNAFFSRVDMLMYEAKSHGRNKVVTQEASYLLAEEE